MQKYSHFHAADEALLKAWHQPYADLFVGCGPVLDLGCGLGYFADLLRERQVEYFGVDLDPEMVSATRARGHEAVHCDVNNLLIGTRRFAGIHISHLIEHLWGEEVIKLLDHCRMLLTDDGVLVIRTPNWANAKVRHHVFWTDHTHRRPYPAELINKILVDLGMVIAEAGAEPYGLNDVYVVARSSALPHGGSLLRFGASPFAAAEVPVPRRWRNVKLLLRRVFAARSGNGTRPMRG